MLKRILRNDNLSKMTASGKFGETVVSCLLSVMATYDVYSKAQTIASAATLRQKIKLAISPSHRALPAGQAMVTLTP